MELEGKIKLILHRLGGQVSLDHERNLECNRMVEFAEVETGELADLFETVYERVSVYEQLSGSLGDVEVVFEEALNGHESFAVERIERTVLEYFLKEHFAEGGGKLINQTADAEIFVADDILFGVEYLADFDGNLSFLVGARKILDVVNNRTDTDGNLRIEFGIEGVGDGLCDLFDFADVRVGLDFLDENDVLFPGGNDVILVLVRENVLNHIEGENIGLGVELNQEDHAGFFRVEAKFLRLDVDVAGENVVENDVLDERTLIVLFIVEILDVGERHCENGGDLFRVLVFPFDEYDVFPLGAGADRLIGISAGGNGIRSVCEFVPNSLSHFANFHKFAARNDDAVIVHDADNAVNSIPHLMNYSLKKTI